MFRKLLTKYLIFILLLWIIYFLLSVSQDDSENNDIENQIINQVIEKVKNEKHVYDNENRIDLVQHVDHDHPEEERLKADKQLRNPEGKIQINAPVLHDLTAPGL